MVTYSYNTDDLEITEQENGDDTEFLINVKNPGKCLEPLKKVKHYFSNNGIITDVLFYPHPNHHYTVIVKKEYYIDFLVFMFRYHLLDSLSW